MDILELLNEDHLFFKDRLSQLRVLASTPELAANRAVAVELVKEIRKRHRDHIRREVELLFPVLKETLASLNPSPVDPSLVHHLQDEHSLVGRALYILLNELESAPTDQSWEKTFRRFEKPFLDHIDAEDNRVFPQAAQVISKDILVRLARTTDFFVN